MFDKLKSLSITTHSKIRLIAQLAGIFIGTVSGEFDFALGMVTGIILILAGFLWREIFMRCPHCNHRFPYRYGIPKHCPNCGGQVL